MSAHYDYIIIGSGFGGAVSALRLSEKGYRVLVLEQGRRFQSSDFPETNWKLRKYLWWPALGMYGIQKLSFFRQASILTGTGVGGGSLVYANTLFYPEQAFFKKGKWAQLKDWEKELKPFYEEAGFMMGRTKLDRFFREDEALRKVAEKMGRETSFENVHVAVNLQKSQTTADPYFKGLGPERNSCTDCAGCMVGCRENAKNTLDKNYLFFAEKLGTTIMEETRVERIEKSGSIYILHARNIRNSKIKHSFTSDKLIVSAGTLGTLNLLLKQKFRFKTLPDLSDSLGENLLTNSETLCAVSYAGEKLNNGVAISSVFHPDDHTHVEIVKYPNGSNALKWFFTLAAGGARIPSLRIFKLLAALFKQPGRLFKTLLKKNWSENMVIFLVMQDLENNMKMYWNGRKMKILNRGQNKVPAYIPIGQEVMHKFAEEVGGIPQNIILEILFNRPTTAHILGGCLMGKDPNESLVNEFLEVHNYPGLYIIDGSVIQTNPGVNPSYSILAMAEYAMSQIPDSPKGGKKLRSMLAKH